MTLTFELSPQREVELREGVARGDAEAVRRVLLESIAPTVDSLLRDPTYGTPTAVDGFTESEFELLVNNLADLEPGLPCLPDEAVNRRSIYEDHL